MWWVCCGLEVDKREHRAAVGWGEQFMISMLILFVHLLLFWHVQCFNRAKRGIGMHKHHHNNQMAHQHHEGNGGV